jgi:hypothetical protein
MDMRTYPSGVPAVDYTYKADPGGQSGVVTPTDFQLMAKQAVAKYYRTNILRLDDLPILEQDVFVVWFTKTLKNWKALCSTIIEDNRYFELTFNGETNELYVDEYHKKGQLTLLLEPTVAELRD